MRIRQITAMDWIVWPIIQFHEMRSKNDYQVESHRDISVCGNVVCISPPYLCETRIVRDRLRSSLNQSLRDTHDLLATTPIAEAYQVCLSRPFLSVPHPRLRPCSVFSVTSWTSVFGDFLAFSPNHVDNGDFLSPT
jgi:hypothetical protein